MKKIFLSLIAIIASMILANAQDFVIMKNGDEIKAKVLEITMDEVKYRLYDEPDGVIYTVWKSDIIMIHYESGRSEVFSQKVMPSPYYSGREPLYNIRPGMKYNELKHLYNHKDYTPSSSDFNPGWCGVASFSSRTRRMYPWRVGKRSGQILWQYGTNECCCHFFSCRCLCRLLL